MWLCKNIDIPNHLAELTANNSPVKGSCLNCSRLPATRTAMLAESGTCIVL